MKSLLDKLHTPTWLFWLLIAILVLRIPTFFEPYAYGDEMIYLTLGEAIRQGIPLYKGVHDNKPPLLYILAAIAGSLFWFKIILTIWCLVTIYLFGRLTATLYPKNSRLQKIAVIIFSILTTIPLLEGNIANAEIFMIGLTIAAFIILLSKRASNKNLLLAGILFSAATLFKVPAMFDIPVIIFYWLITSKINKKSIIKISRKALFITIGLAAPIFLTFVWYFLRGAFKEYLIAAFLQNVGYLSSWRPEDVQKSFLIRNTPLLARAGVVTAGVFILYLKRKRLSKQFIFLTLWLLFSLFAVTLSERPYPHYLIQSVPATSILLAMFFTLKTIEQVLVIIPLFIFSFVPYFYNFWYYPTLPYYERFVKYINGKVSSESFANSFNKNTTRNYKVADFIVQSTSPEDKVFVWGDTATIYALSKRFPPIKYIADYHVRDFYSIESLVRSLTSNPPRLIIMLPDSGTPIDLYFFVRENYVLIEEIDGAEIWSPVTI